MSQDEKVQSQYMGQQWNGFRAIKPRIRIHSLLEVAAQVKNFQQLSGLEAHQFVDNVWGFPFIPIPEPKSTYQGWRMAPRNVTPAFLGHPIYWIDPELTKRREDENLAQWAMRMFFLIDAFGYWDELGDFTDFLKVNEFMFSPAQIQIYHSIADQVCESDSFDLLNESDLYTSLEEVEKEYFKARKFLFNIQDKASVSLQQKQIFQYSFAKKILGSDVRSMSAIYNNRGGMWDKYFVPRLEGIAHEYNIRAESGSQIVSDLLTRTREIFDDLEDAIVRMNHATSMLGIAVLAGVNSDRKGAIRISFMASHMAAANSKNNVRKTILKDLDEHIGETFISGNTGVGGFDPLIREMEQIYAIAWNRLRLAYINFENFAKGEKVYSNTVEMQAGLESANLARQSQLDNLDAILEDDFR